MLMNRVNQAFAEETTTPSTNNEFKGAAVFVSPVKENCAFQ